MRVKEVIIDGFKSYANRTVISGFDKSFNAITGRNGTGKSNILDAICFVLGISKLSQVRRHNFSLHPSLLLTFLNNEKKSSFIHHYYFLSVITKKNKRT